MEIPVNNQKVVLLNSRFLWFLTLSYTMLIIMSGWFSSHTIRIFSLDINSGILISPLLFILLSLITEVYGYKHARSAIWCGFLLNLIFICYSQSIVHLPSPDYAKNNPAFDALLEFNTKIIFASDISYFISAFLNSLLIVKLKTFMKNRYISIRFILSNIIALSVFSIIFKLILFFQGENNQNLFIFILSTNLIMMFLLPLSIFLTKKIKQVEKLNIYDKSTRFNIFSFEVSYTTQDNEFSNHRK